MFFSVKGFDAFAVLKALANKLNDPQLKKEWTAKFHKLIMPEALRGNVSKYRDPAAFMEIEHFLGYAWEVKKLIRGQQSLVIAEETAADAGDVALSVDVAAVEVEAAMHTDMDTDTDTEAAVVPEA